MPNAAFLLACFPTHMMMPPKIQKCPSNAGIHATMLVTPCRPLLLFALLGSLPWYLDRNTLAVSPSSSPFDKKNSSNPCSSQLHQVKRHISSLRHVIIESSITTSSSKLSMASLIFCAFLASNDRATVKWCTDSCFSFMLR